ncbi:ABC transporter ATP-binding protein [Ferrimonas aestuarii]|uniref:ABC transporter ATP-binding protein n=1 Tax=Ferrimonas aestuarii TaxID=2569539 RepID=A0A4U1BGD8_9GAMM|nr:ABC transporter ATP-binding protein [Ferrimonas aestuarii]TKB50032.1 ABC transporter ATP-binding protein [Ferrimonas aestuarii]
MARIDIRDLRFSRDQFQLSLPQLRIHQGEKVALMGENGCGKSTLIALMTGLLQPATGQIQYDGQPLEALDYGERARCFSLLPQFSTLAFPFTVLEVVQMGRFAKLQSSDYQQADLDASRQLLTLMDIAHLEHKAFSELSGGEQRRVMLARVLNQQTPIVYLDEPNASLDVRHTLDTFAHLYELPATVITSVHDINMALRYFDRFLFFKNGQLLADRQRSELTPQLLNEVYDVSVVSSGDGFSFHRSCR